MTRDGDGMMTCDQDDVEVDFESLYDLDEPLGDEWDEYTPQADFEAFILRETADQP